MDRRRRAEDVAHRIEQSIGARRYGSGGTLPSERALQAAFLVGRSTIREALSVLRHKGLIDVQHGRRTQILEPDIAAMRQLFANGIQQVVGDPNRFIDDLKQLRLTLEVAMATRAAEVATEQDIVRLKSALAANRKAISSRELYLESDIAFHVTIASITGNRIFAGMASAILQWLARYRTDLVHVKGANILSHDEHAQIAGAICDRDPTAAADAMRRHQLRSHALYSTLATASLDGAQPKKKQKPKSAQPTGRKSSCSGERPRRSSR